jgi:hypothetical protein
MASWGSIIDMSCVVSIPSIGDESCGLDPIFEVDGDAEAFIEGL